MRQLRGKSASGMANVDQRDGVGAGVGGDDAAQREDDERVFAESFAAGPDEVVLDVEATAGGNQRVELVFPPNNSTSQSGIR